jgi:hypothetical protein
VYPKTFSSYVAYDKCGEPVFERRPKLLFLASNFPPLLASGSVRSRSIARNLVRLGWDVTVVTPHPSIWRNVENIEQTDIRIARDGIKRILTDYSCRWLDPYTLKCRNQGISWILGGVCRRVARRFWVDTAIGWITAAEKACSELNSNDVDVIMATASPFTSFTVAKRLSEKLRRPYVLDYRDPWTGNPHVDRPFPNAIIQRESKLLADSAAVTIVSPSWASVMNRRFGLGPKLHVITNWYDPADLAEVKPHDFGHFAIVYTGNFYPPKRVISPVMAALKRLKERVNRTQCYFHYYGADKRHVEEEAIRFNVRDRVVLHGRVQRAEALSAVRGAGVNVVITSVADKGRPEDNGIVPAKIFETIGLGCPTLLIAPSGSDVEAIAETTGLIRRCPGTDIAGIVSFFESAMRGVIPAMRDRDEYAWTTLATKLDSLLRPLTRLGVK